MTPIRLIVRGYEDYTLYMAVRFPQGLMEAGLEDLTPVFAVKESPEEGAPPLIEATFPIFGSYPEAFILYASYRNEFLLTIQSQLLTPLVGRKLYYGFSFYENLTLPPIIRLQGSFKVKETVITAPFTPPSI